MLTNKTSAEISRGFSVVKVKAGKFDCERSLTCGELEFVTDLEVGMPQI
jgi:hypothetical protein